MNVNQNQTQSNPTIKLANIHANTAVVTEGQSVANKDAFEENFAKLFGIEGSTKAIEFPAERTTTQESAIAETMKECELLAEKCADYEQEFIARGNIALYELLQKVYVVSIQIETSAYKHQILSTLREALRNKGIKVQLNTPDLTVLTKYVVGGDRKRASNYSRVLRIAAEDNVVGTELASYISRRGGMGKIYKNEVKAAALELASGTTKERLELMKEYLLLRQWESRTEFKYEQPIDQHNADKQGKAESASFCFFMTAYDRSKNVYRVIGGHDFGKSYEDNILRFIIKTATNDIEKIKKGVARYKQELAAKKLLPNSK